MGSRRGQEGGSLWYVIAIAVGLLLLVGAVIFIYNGFTSAKNAADCFQQGGKCQETPCDLYATPPQMSAPQGSCNDKFITTSFCCKKEGDKPYTAQELSKAKADWTAAQRTAELVSMLKAPVITVTEQSTGRPVASSQTLTYFAGDPAAIFSLNAVETYIEKCDDPSLTQTPSLRNDPRATCGMSGVRYVLETSNNQVLYSYEKEVVAKTNAFAISGFAKEPKISSDNGIARATYTRDFAFTPSPDLVGQTLHLSVVAYPIDSNSARPGDKPSLESRYELYFKVLSPVTVTGLSSTWTKSKTVQASCDAALGCTNILYEVKQDTGSSPNYDCTPSAMSAEKAEKFPLAPLTINGWCMSDKDGKVNPDTAQCFDQLAACETARGQQADPAYAGTMSAVLKAMQGSTGTGAQTVPAWAYNTNNMVESQSVIRCVPTPMSDPKGAGKGAVGQVYRTRYDPAKKRVAITLDQGYAAGKGKYLCVYGQDASGKRYASRGAPIFVDIIPPTVKAKFNPGTQQLTFHCEDTDSGCKTSFGIGFVNQLTNFFQALFGSPQSASTWCPASAASYRPETITAMPYYGLVSKFQPGSDIFVLCYRHEDNAGNSAVAMTQVYDLYGTAAKAIAMAMQ